MLHPAHGVLNLRVPSVLGDLDGGFSLGSGDFGSGGGKRLRDRIDEMLDHQRLRANGSALSFAIALVREDGEVCERKGERHATGLERIRQSSIVELSVKECPESGKMAETTYKAGCEAHVGKVGMIRFVAGREILFPRGVFSSQGYELSVKRTLCAASHTAIEHPHSSPQKQKLRSFAQDQSCW